MGRIQLHTCYLGRRREGISNEKEVEVSSDQGEGDAEKSDIDEFLDTLGLGTPQQAKSQSTSLADVRAAQDAMLTRQEAGGGPVLIADNKEKELKFGDIFMTMEHADVAIRQYGAVTMPYRVMPGGGQTKRIYVCACKRKSAFGPRTLWRKKGDDDRNDGNADQGQRKREAGDELAACLQRGQEEGNCTAFVQVQKVTARNLLTGKYRKCVHEATFFSFARHK